MNDSRVAFCYSDEENGMHASMQLHLTTANHRCNSQSVLHLCIKKEEEEAYDDKWN